MRKPIEFSMTGDALTRFFLSDADRTARLITALVAADKYGEWWLDEYIEKNQIGIEFTAWLISGGLAESDD